MFSSLQLYLFYPVKSHNVFIFELFHIDPFFLDNIDSFQAEIGIFFIFYFYCHALSSPYMTTSTPFEIMDSPPPHSS